MRRRATEGVWVLATVAWCACGGSPAGSSPDRAPLVTAPAAAPGSSGAIGPVMDASAAAPGLSGSGAAVAAAAAEPPSSTSDALPPPRPVTIPLASGGSAPGDSDLAAGDEA